MPLTCRCCCTVPDCRLTPLCPLQGHKDRSCRNSPGLLSLRLPVSLSWAPGPLPALLPLVLTPPVSGKAVAGSSARWVCSSNSRRGRRSWVSVKGLLPGTSPFSCLTQQGRNYVLPRGDFLSIPAPWLFIFALPPTHSSATSLHTWRQLPVPRSPATLGTSEAKQTSRLPDLFLYVSETPPFLHLLPTPSCPKAMSLRRWLLLQES